MSNIPIYKFQLANIPAFLPIYNTSALTLSEGLVSGVTTLPVSRVLWVSDTFWLSLRKFFHHHSNRYQGNQTSVFFLLLGSHGPSSCQISWRSNKNYRKINVPDTRRICMWWYWCMPQTVTHWQSFEWVVFPQCARASNLMYAGWHYWILNHIQSKPTKHVQQVEAIRDNIKATTAGRNGNFHTSCW